PIAKVEFLYGVGEVSVYNGDGDRPSNSRPVILAGYNYAESGAKNVVPATLLDYEDQTKFVSSMRCGVGHRVATALKLAEYVGLTLRNGKKLSYCGAVLLPATGGPEDDQIFFYLQNTQDLLGQQGHVSLIQLYVPGTPQQVERFVADLQPQLG